MKRISLLVAAALFFCISARAQETPHWEIGGGYTYGAININPSYSSRSTLNGGNFSITENMTNWFGGRFELNALMGTQAGVNVNAQTYTFGPVFSTHRFERVTPFAHAQFGAIHGSTGYIGISMPASRFAMTGGAGVDFALNRRAAVRLQGDYLLTHFLGLRQNNLLLSAGVVIRIGSR